MRYQEAYTLVNDKVKKHDIVVGERILDNLFDTAVKDLGLRVVRKEDSEDFAVSGRTYVFTKENISEQIIRVQRDSDEPLPPSDKSILKLETGSRGYYIDQDVNTGLITAGTSADPIVLTSVAHGRTTGDHVFLSEIVGLLSAAGALSALNDLKHTITVVDDDNFSIDIDGSAYAVAWASGGKWECQNKVLTLGATPDNGTITVDYVAKPEKRTSLSSRIDLPDTLVWACIFGVLAKIYETEGDIIVPVGDRAIILKPGDKYESKALKEENRYLLQLHMREYTPYVLPSAMEILS